MKRGCLSIGTSQGEFSLEYIFKSCGFSVSCLSECVSVKCYSVYFVLFLQQLFKENIVGQSQKFVNCFETFPSTKSNMSSKWVEWWLADFCSFIRGIPPWWRLTFILSLNTTYIIHNSFRTNMCQHRLFIFINTGKCGCQSFRLICFYIFLTCIKYICWTKMTKNK